MIRSLLIIVFLSVLSSTAQAGKIRALIVDGQNRHHKWEKTTPVIKKILEDTGRFEVTVLTSPGWKDPKDAWQKFTIDYDSVDVILLNYWGPDWPKAVWEGFEAFVKEGGGVVPIHSAIAGFGGKPLFHKMCGVGWRGGPNSGRYLFVDADGKIQIQEKGEGEGSVGHSHRHAYPITIHNPDHPIVAGMGSPWKHAKHEMYHRLRGPAEDMVLLGTALSPQTKVHEPMMWTIPIEKGRSFVTTLGHDVEAMSSEGFRVTLARGAEWAATGKVAKEAP